MADVDLPAQDSRPQYYRDQEAQRVARENEVYDFWKARLNPDVLREFSGRVSNGIGNIGDSEMAVWVQKTGMNPEQIRALYHVLNAKGGGVIIGDDYNKSIKLLDTGMGEAQAADAAKNEAKIRGDITGNIQKWIDSLGVADPDVSARLAARARTAASNQAGRAGVGSLGSGGAGLSALGQANINKDLDAKYSLERAGLQQQGYNLLNTRDLGLGQLEQGWAGIQDARAGQRWAADKNTAQGVGGAIGGIAGTVIGAVTGIPGLGQVGAAGGAGLGGLATGGGGPSYSPAGSVGSARGGGWRGGSLGNTGF